MAIARAVAVLLASVVALAAAAGARDRLMRGDEQRVRQGEAMVDFWAGRAQTDAGL